MYESKVYKQLQGTPGIPKFYWEGEEGDYKVMVTELLGPDLKTLLCICHNQFTLSTTLLIANQLVGFYISIFRFHCWKIFITMDLSIEILSQAILLLIMLKSQQNCI